MNINTLLPFGSTAIILVFAALVFRRYGERKGLHLLIWGIGLVMFGIGSLAESYSVFGWNALVFRSWYLFGAVLVAAWLGQGTVYLLARRRVAHVLLVLLILGSLFALQQVFSLPLDSSRFLASEPLSAQYREILPAGALVRKLTPIFNIYGTFTLIGGAIYSAWIFWRKRIMPHRVIGNTLIAIGALVIAFASTLTRLGLGQYLYLGELLAAILMFIGFLRATVEPTVPASEPAKAPETA
ncbi:MAG: hypothetical protein ACE5NP_00935 [Anaerolineae bacterium]